jgi:YHS domain-containing protein
MKSLCVPLVLALALCAVSAAATAQTTDAKAGKAITPQTTCPVMGGKIDKNQYADYQGKRVYFCCPDCKATFDEDPAKYVKKLEDAGVTLEKTPVPQTTCPVLGNKIDKSLYADYKGKRVYFCCAGCVDEFKKDPEKYIKKLEDAGVTLEKTPVPQTACPVLDGKINKDLYADYKGKRVYFCRADCVDEFKKDPAKYVKKLEDAGVTLEKTPEAAKPGKDQAAMDHSSAAGHGGATSAKPK